MFQVSTFSHGPGIHEAAHRHAEGQLFILRRGTSEVRSGNADWLMLPGRPCWLPPHVPHAVVSRQAVRGLTLKIDERYCGSLPPDTAVLRAPDFLLAALDRLEACRNDAVRARRLVSVILDELPLCEPDLLCLPMPKTEGLKKLANALAQAPDDRRDLAAWSRDVGMSSRSLVRRFPAETGLTFGQWRNRARVIKAIGLLQGGASVTETAFSVGYESVSAFSAVFRATIGLPPGHFKAAAG